MDELLQVVMNCKAWFDAVPVLVVIFGAALILDVDVVTKMFFSRELYLWMNWLVSAVFLISFLNIVSMRYESVEELSLQTSLLIILVSSFGYLIMFFAAVVAHSRLQTALGKPSSATSIASLIFGMVFACGCLAWRILLPNGRSSSSSPSTSYTLPAMMMMKASSCNDTASSDAKLVYSTEGAPESSPTLVLFMVLGLIVVIVAIYFARSASGDAYDSDKNRKSREFRNVRKVHAYTLNECLQ